MSFNSLNQYSATHKVWDHVGNIVPELEHSEGIRPAFPFKPAEWLPVQFYDKYYENWFVIMPGKAIALDPNGDLMPAHYGLTSASVTYTQNDVDAGVIDIATGLPVTAAKTVTLSNLTGTRHSTWTRANAGTGSVTSGFLGKYGTDGNFADATQKYPIGVAPYPYLQWCGGDGVNPANYRKHNYNMQHQVAVLCDYVLRLPLVPAQTTSETVNKTNAAGNLVFGTRGSHTRGQAQGNSTGRYNSSTGSIPVLDSYPVMALALDETGLAKNTARTTIALASSTSSDNVSSILVNERSSLSAVRQAGDYWVDYPVGVIFIYSNAGDTLPTALSGAAGTVTITYYRYGAAASTLSKFGQVLGGPLVPGEFLKVGTESNLVPISGSEDFKEIVGQVIGFEDFPKDGLDRVRTAYNPAINTNSAGSMANGTAGSASANLGQLDQMPGSATGGVDASIHYAGAANRVCVVNLISR